MPEKVYEVGMRKNNRGGCNRVSTIQIKIGRGIIRAVLQYRSRKLRRLIPSRIYVTYPIRSDNSTSALFKNENISNFKIFPRSVCKRLTFKPALRV